MIIDLAAADQERCMGMPETMRRDPRHPGGLNIHVQIVGQTLAGKRGNVTKDKVVRREAILPALLDITGP